MFHRNIIFHKNSFQNLTVKHKKSRKKVEKIFVFLFDFSMNKVYNTAAPGVISKKL